MSAPSQKVSILSNSNRGTFSVRFTLPTSGLLVSVIDYFSVNGMDVTIWTAVETATAIVASSIPVLRVFFREKASTLGYEKSTNENSNDVVLNTYHTRVVDLSVATDTSKPPDEISKELKADETRRNTILPEIREFEPLYDEIMREKCFDVESQNGSRKDEITEKNDMSA